MKITGLLFLVFAFNSLAKEKIVAKVGDVEITKSKFDKAFKEKLFYPTHKKITKESVLLDLVNREAAIVKAKKENLENNEEVKVRINSILHNALLDRELRSKFEDIKVTDSEVKKYYETHKEYKTSQILYRVQAMPSKGEVKSAYRLMANIHSQIKKNPKRFEELAVKHSQVSTNKSGGDIGFVPHTSMAPEYYEAIKGKSVGYITDPIRSQFGYHIVKVTGIKDYSKINKGLYKKIIFDQKRDKILESYYAKLRKEIKVNLNKENL